MTALRLSEIILPAYYVWWHTAATYVVCKGSRGSGKSKQTALWLVFFMMQFPLANALVIRKVARTLRDSCYSDIQWAIRRLGVEAYWSCTTSPMEITYRKTGQKILFRGMDEPLKLASISVPVGFLCWAWFEEFYEITREADFDMVDESIRGILPPGYFKRIFITFNPWSERHFAKARFFDCPPANVLAMTTTYKDNPYLSPADIALFQDMRIRNPRRYRVAGEGEWGISEGLIYENWTERAFDISDIGSCRGACGLDYGYTNDPSAFVAQFYDAKARRLWILDEIYERGLSNRAIYSRITAKGYGKETITADSAEPKSNDELRSFGLRIRDAIKGPGSINAGIQWVQDQEILVHPRCVNTIREFGMYAWEKDRFGKVLNVPQDADNHTMDAIRYGVSPHIGRRSCGKVMIQR